MKLCSRHVLLAVLAAIFSTCSVAVSAQQTFLVCSTLTDDQQRLQCFDEAVKNHLKTHPETRSVTVAGPGQVSDASETSAGVEPSALTTISPTVSAPASSSASESARFSDAAEAARHDNFGFEHKPGRNPEQEISRQVQVVSASHNNLLGWTLELDNGQVWQQVGTDSYRVKEGEFYVISRAAFNSFQLGNEANNRKISIRRIE